MKLIINHTLTTAERCLIIRQHLTNITKIEVKTLLIKHNITGRTKALSYFGKSKWVYSYETHSGNYILPATYSKDGQLEVATTLESYLDIIEILGSYIQTSHFYDPFQQLSGLLIDCNVSTDKVKSALTYTFGEDIEPEYNVESQLSDSEDLTDV